MRITKVDNDIVPHSGGSRTCLKHTMIHRILPGKDIHGKRRSIHLVDEWLHFCFGLDSYNKKNQSVQWLVLQRMWHIFRSICGVWLSLGDVFLKNEPRMTIMWRSTTIVGWMKLFSGSILPNPSITCKRLFLSPFKEVDETFCMYASPEQSVTFQITLECLIRTVRRWLTPWSTPWHNDPYASCVLRAHSQ